MLIKSESLLYADAVLAYLYIIHGESDRESYLHIECWSNCREQGYHISNGAKNRAVNFGRSRNCDSIIVGFGETMDFMLGSNQWNEQVYNNKKYFSNAEEAAKFIHDWLMKG